MRRTVLLTVVTIISCLLLFSASNIIAQEPCTADFNCDLSVDGGDVDVFLNQFGRNPFMNNPCPDCYDSDCPCSAQGCDPPAPVEKSGQTTSYATGDDGDLEKGETWPNPRFTDNLDGTITDNLTGLIWLKDANCFGTRTWDFALSDCAGLASGSCGLTDGSGTGDWRLPNRSELFSLIHDEYYNPSLPNTAGTGQWSQGDPFNNVQFSYYWSSSTLAGYPDDAWLVYLSFGYVHSINKFFHRYVWPVRGGQ